MAETRVGEAYRGAAEAVQSQLWPLLFAAFLAFLLNLPAGAGHDPEEGGPLLPIPVPLLLVSWSETETVVWQEGGRGVSVRYPGSWQAWLGVLWRLLVMPPLALGLLGLGLDAVRGRRIEIGRLFRCFEGIRPWSAAVVAALVYQLAVGLGCLLCIVPGVVLLCRLAFFPYLVLEEERWAFGALSESWARTSGIALSVLGVQLLAIVLAFLGALCCIVGVFPATLLGLAALAFLYDRRSPSVRRI